MLHCSVESGNDRLVERIIKLTPEEHQKAFVNIKKENGFTALHIAAEFGYYNIGAFYLKTESKNNFSQNFGEVQSGG